MNKVIIFSHESDIDGLGNIAAAAVDITKEQKKKVLSLSKREALEYIANAKF